MKENRHAKGSGGQIGEPGEDNALRPVCIIGRNAVLEALRSGRPLESIYIGRQEDGPGSQGSLGKIAAMAREAGIPVKDAKPVKLDALSGGGSHQGVVAVASVQEYVQLEDILDRAAEKGEPPFLVLCDGLEDPHNLGAVIRTAEAAGAHGIVVPKRRTAGLTPAVYKASAGALEYVPVARVPNMAAAVDTLKERGVWVYGADPSGETWCTLDYKGPVALVIGSEGEGISRIVREKCDFLVSLPMTGKITSLNASVAAGILMYEMARQRTGIPSRPVKS